MRKKQINPLDNEEYQRMSRVFWEKERKISEAIDVLKSVQQRLFQEHYDYTNKLMEENS